MRLVQRVPTLLLCFAIGIVAFVVLDFWSARNSPLYRRLELQWSHDIEALQESGKLPKQWFDVGELEVIGGTPETKDMLNRIQLPLQLKKDGANKLEILVVAWEEEGKRGAMIQYNLVDRKTKNGFWELGRTLILSRPQPKNIVEFLEELKSL